MLEQELFTWLPGLGVLAVIWTVCGFLGWRELRKKNK